MLNMKLISSMKRDIIVRTNDGTYIKTAWHGLNCFGWNKWEKLEDE